MIMPFRVFALGSNGSGQLALGHTEDVSVPEECKFVDGQLQARPCTIAAGGNHSLMLCEDGSLFAAGESEDGRCGVSDVTGSLTSFRRVIVTGAYGRYIDKFAHCSATWEASTFVTTDGSVYTCGTGLKGELGQGEEAKHVNKPRVLANFPPAGTDVIKLASCMSHTVGVLSNGDVYGWGSGRKGQLGEPADTVWTPRKIEGVPFPVVHAACGREFTCLLGHATTGAHLILGSNKWCVRSSAPKSVEGWKEVSASWSGMHILFEDSKILGWGRNDNGQHPPSAIENLRHLAVGSEHALADDESGNVVAWGWGEHGNCGESVLAMEAAASNCNVISTSGQLSVLGAGCATSWLLED